MDWTHHLQRIHRAFESSIDSVMETLELRPDDLGQAISCARTQALGCYSAHDMLLRAIAPHHPAVASKLAAQQAEALELADAAQRSLSEGNRRDAAALARRFCAIAQHNLIEWERDVFPLVTRWLSPVEQARLWEALSNDYDQTV